jgi:hypothetical protein
MSGTIQTTNVATNSGNRVVIEINNQKVGLIQTVRMSDDYGHEPASGVGDIHVIENVPSRAMHTLEVTNMVLLKGNMRDLGIAPENGDAVLQGIVYDLVVYSKDTNAELRRYISCSWISGSTSIDAHRIIMQQGSLRALDVKDTNL